MNSRDTSHADQPAAPNARMLLDLLRPASASTGRAQTRDLSAPAWKGLSAQATRHGVAPLLHRALQSEAMRSQIPEEILVQLAGERRITALDNLRNFGEFRRVARALQTHGISIIALKGMHLADLVYRDISLRPMSDIDILTPRAQVDAAVEVLVSLGYRANATRPSGYDICLTDPRRGILLELHWNLAGPSESCSPPIDQIWRTAVRARLADADVLVMTPEFLMLHICAHLAYHHLFAVDFRALCDIDEIVRTSPKIDWEFFAGQARASGMSRGVAATLRMARDQLGTAVPEDVLAALGGDALEDRLLEDALEQLSTNADLPRALRFAPNLLTLTDRVGPLARISTIWKRVFLPNAELAALYAAPSHPLRILPYYVIRLRDLLRTYAGSAWTLASNRTDLAATSARSERLAKWLSGA